MPDNTRTVYETAAPNAAADALFGVFKSNQELEHYAKKKEIDTGAAMKLKTMEQENQTALASLNNKYNLEMLQKRVDINLADTMRRGSALTEAVGSTARDFTNQTGQAIPGMTFKAPAPLQQGSALEAIGQDSPMGATGGAPAYNPQSMQAQSNSMNPLAADFYAGKLDKYMTDQMATARDDERMDLQLKRDTLREKLGWMTDAELKTAQNYADRLEAIDPEHPNIPLFRGMAPGTRKEHFYPVADRTSKELQAAAHSLERTKLMGETRKAVALEVAKIDAESKMAIAKLKQGGDTAKEGLKTLKAAQANYMAQHQILKTQYEGNLAISLNEGGVARKTALAEMSQQKMAMDAIERSVQNLGIAMLQNDNVVERNALTAAEEEAENLEIGGQVTKEFGLKADPPKGSALEAKSTARFNELKKERQRQRSANQQVKTR